MKRILFLLLPLAVLFSCSDNLDIKKDYDFIIKTLPINKKIKKGQTVPLEFTIIRDKVYNNTTYSFRYFQSDGKGILTNDAGTPFAVNRFYPLDDEFFKLLYRSECNETQTLDFVFVDSFGKEVQYSISFQDNLKD